MKTKAGASLYASSVPTFRHSWWQLRWQYNDLR